MTNPSRHYLLSLSMENVRCFRQARLNLREPDGTPSMWTVILGENGRGKTTILQALTALSYPSRLHRQEHARWHELLSETSTLKLETMELDSPGRGSMTRTLTYDSEEQGFVKSGGKHSSPLLAYGATRRSSPSSLGADSDSTDPFSTLFSPEARLLNAEEWLLRLDYAARASSEPTAARARLERVRSVLTDLLPDIQELVIEPPRDETGGRVRFITPFGPVSLMDLGLGYQAMIAWVVDLMARLHRLYPESKNPAHEPCVVLVDEIDLHLHPTWQRDIKRYLQHHFPQAQFIVTAHSPLMVQSALDDNLALLVQEGNQVRIVNDPAVVRGWRVDQVLTSDLFGLTSARPPQTAELLDERTRLVARGSLGPREEARIAEIDQALAELPTEECHDAQRDLDDLARLAQRVIQRMNDA